VGLLSAVADLATVPDFLPRFLVVAATLAVLTGAPTR
jgi:hypothetical protein